MGRVAVLVPVHNALDVTRRCIETLRDELANTDTSLHVYDDASGAETADYLRSLTGVHYLRNETPRGYAHHLNTLALWCLSQQIPTACVANSDLLFPPTSFSRMATQAAGSWGSWDGIGDPPKTLFLGPSLSAAGSGQLSDPELKRINPIKAWESIKDIQASSDRVAMPSVQMPSVNGACFMYSTQAVVRYGFFDERFRRGSAEEEEWMRRVVRESGGSNGLHVKASCVYHWKHASFKNANVKSADLWRGNVIKMQAKIAANEDFEHVTHPRNWPKFIV